jgi:hypothetical protein
MTRGLLKSDDPNLFWGFHHGKSRTLVTKTPKFMILDFPKWDISRHVASLNWMIQIYFGAFTLIHWGFNPQVSPNRSNGCRVFQPTSDGSDQFLTCAFSQDFLDMEKNQWSRCSHGPWGSTVTISSLPNKTQKNKRVRHLTPYLLLPI